jgi:hypothetical protein
MSESQLNLPFEIASLEGSFLESLSIQDQELLWKKYYDEFEQAVINGSAECVSKLGDSITEMEQIIESGSRAKLLEQFEGDSSEGISVSKNPYTGELINTKSRDINSLADDELKALLKERITNERKFLNSAIELRMARFWPTEIEWFDEGSLLELANDIPGMEKIYNDFKTFTLREELVRRARLRVKNLHSEYANQAMDFLVTFGKTDPSNLSAPKNELSDQASSAVAEGRRLTSEGGPCYVCGEFIWPMNGELLLWREIPKGIRDSLIPGIFQKWHIRHLSPECSRPELGKRNFFLHPKGPFVGRNTKPDKCIVCDINVPAESGWLIPVSSVPKWKQDRPAFPGAKPKKYYVSCGKED